MERPLPELDGAAEWLNGEVKREDLAGSPTLVHFWAKSCYICHENMPTVAQWRETYGPQGLKFVAVHMPRQEEDTDIAAVKADAAAMNLAEPCAIDNEHAIGERFQSAMWPAYFVFDRDGNMKSRAAGHAGLSIIEEAIKRVLTAEPQAV